MNPKSKTTLKANGLNHKGFQGNWEYSDEDRCWFGKITNIPDLVMYEGDSKAEMKKAFIEAVEDYIGTLGEIGIPPKANL